MVSNERLADVQAKTSGCCLRSSKPGANEQKQDANSLSTTVDFNVDLNDFDFRSFSSEMAKKLREGGKLDKLIAQAVGMGATKMGALVSLLFAENFIKTVYRSLSEAVWISRNVSICALRCGRMEIVRISLLIR